MMKTDERWEAVPKEERNAEEIIRPTIPYWKDVLMKLCRNPRAVFGAVLIILLVVAALFGPMLTGFSYSDQNIEFANVQPIMNVYQLDEDFYVYVTPAYKLYEVDVNGTLIRSIPEKTYLGKDPIFIYGAKDEEIILDYSEKDTSKNGFKLIYNEKEFTAPDFKKLNKTYPFGTDSLGRDELTRVLYGGRVSIAVALIATLMSTLIGITYGSIAGWRGGMVDIIMMRIVDILSTIPTTLIVILFMVLFNSQGALTIVVVLGLTYWFATAGLVRGKVLEMKHNDYIMAARVLGVTDRRIIVRHLIPNAIGPIIVSLTMSIPLAIFTESFLSFLGLGVTIPKASWGALASEALNVFPRYSWQMFYPAFAIAFTVLAFNFLGDGLADALDPKQKN